MLEIEGDYSIDIISRGTYFLMPLSPEGPFPQWADASYFVTTGPGNKISDDELKFDTRNNLRSGPSNKYSEGTLVLNFKKQTLTLNAKLSKDYSWGFVNHSGSYPVITNRPIVYDIKAFRSQEEMIGKYVKAIGTLKDFKFYTGTYVFKDRQIDMLVGPRPDGVCNEPSKDTTRYEIIGLVDRYLQTDKRKFEIRIHKATRLKD
jgi:hypothetical protein